MTRLDSLTFSYPEVGDTRVLGASGAVLDDRYRVFDETWVVGNDRSQFEAASECLMTLEMHRAAGLAVAMGPDLVEEGSAFRLGIGVGPFRIEAPCRVVYTLDDTADRSGFAYGTLVGHPERGEARFELTHDEGERQVRFRIATFSRPESILARLGGGVTRFVQRQANKRYLAAIEAACSPHEAAALDRHFALRRLLFGLAMSVAGLSIAIWGISRLTGHPTALGIAAGLMLALMPLALLARIVPSSRAELVRTRTGPKPTLKDWLIAAAWVITFLVLIYTVPLALLVMAVPAALSTLAVGIRFVWRGAKALLVGKDA